MYVTHKSVVFCNWCWMADVIYLKTNQDSIFLTLCLPCLRKTRFGVYGQGGWPPNIHAPCIPGIPVAGDPRLVGWDFSASGSLCWHRAAGASEAVHLRGKLFFGYLSGTQNEIQQLQEIRSLLCFVIWSQLLLLPTSLSKPSDSRRILPVLPPVPLISSSR